MDEALLDKAEARRLANEFLAEWAAKPYRELTHHIDRSHKFEIRAASRKRYAVQVQVFWDSGPTKREPQPAIRILVAVDDGGLSALIPLCVSRLVRPDTVSQGVALEASTDSFRGA